MAPRHGTCSPPPRISERRRPWPPRGQFHRQDGPGQPAGQHREEQGKTDEDRTPMADEEFKKGGRRRIAEAGDLLLVHDAEGQHGEQAIEAGADGETDEGRAAHLCRPAGAGGHDHGGLNPEEHPERHEHGDLDLGEDASQLLLPTLNVEGEFAPADENPHHRQNEGDRGDVDHGLEDVRAHGPLCSSCSGWAWSRIAIGRPSAEPPCLLLALGNSYRPLAKGYGRWGNSGLQANMEQQPTVSTCRLVS